MDQEHFYRKVLQISHKYGIPMSNIMDFLDQILKNPSNSGDLITKTGLSRNIINILRKELSEVFLPTNNLTQLNTYGSKLVADMFHTIELESRWNGLSEFINQSHQQRPQAERQLDQFHATSETVLERVKIMAINSDIRYKRILLLGDDDFLSLSLGFLNIADEIDVIETDSRIIKTISEISKKNNLNINLIEHNLRNKLPGIALSKYDVVFTDPPYTNEGIKLFLSRAITALKPTNKSARIYFCYGNSDLAPEKFIEIQKSISELGLMIRIVKDKFNRYIGAESIGNSSNLYICDVSPKTSSIVNGNYEGKLYTNN